MVAQVLATVLLHLWLFRPPATSGQLIMLGKEGDPFNFPWVCRIKYANEPPFTMCSIFHDNYAFTSADNWNTFSVGEPGKRYYEILARSGGENFLLLGEKEMPNPEEEASAKLLRLWLPTTAKIVNASVQEGQSMYKANPNSLQDFAFDTTGGFTMGVALVQLVGNSQMGNHQWTYEMLPMPMYDTNIPKVEEASTFWITILEVNPHVFAACSAGTLRKMPSGWDNRGLRRPTVIYHQVTYVPRDDCRAAYCSADMSLCMSFPVDSHLVCFKPNTYTDFCDYDRGIALWCPWFESSVFAILTHTDSCGYRRLPSIYTLISGPLRLFAAVTKAEALTIPERPNYDNYRFFVPLPPYEHP